MSDAIDRYVRESNEQIDQTRTQVLKNIKTFDVADKHFDAITGADITDLAQEKLNSGGQPQTVANYVSHLGAVFSIARPTWDFPLSARTVEDARKVSVKLGITGRGRERDRQRRLV